MQGLESGRPESTPAPPKDRPPDHQPTRIPLATVSPPKNMNKSSQLKGCWEDHVGGAEVGRKNRW